MPRRLLHLVPDGMRPPASAGSGDVVVRYRPDGPDGDIVFESDSAAGREAVSPERLVSLLFECDGVVGW